jgi:hypothetical protein
MRTLTLIALLAACGKGGDKGAGSGSATENSGSAGSATTAPPPAADASTVATFKQTITSGGVGPVTDKTDPASVAMLFPGLDSVTTHDVAEDHNFDTVTFSQSGTVVLDVVITNMNRAPQIFRVDVYGSRFATMAGIRIGSTVGDLVAKDPNVECRRETYDPNPEHFDKALFCESPALQNVRFYLDWDALQGPNGKVIVSKLAALPFKRIIWMPPQAAAPTGPTPAEVAAAGPYCFAPNTEFVVDRFVATDDNATFCAPTGGKLTCVTVTLATGAFAFAAGAPPPKPPAEPSPMVDSDGKFKLKRTPKAVSIVDAKTNKDITTLNVGDKDFRCVESVRFLRSYIYATASLCNMPRAVGFIYSPDGKQQGGTLDGVNLQDSLPFHLKGDRWAFKSNDTEAVMILDAANGDVGAVDPMTKEQAGKCCPAKITGTIPPLALTPKNKLISLGGVVGVIDLATGKAEHSWPLPICK